MSIASRTLKPSELPNLDRAKEAALRYDYPAWIGWMRAHFTYSEAVRMATFLGIKKPSKALYDALRTYQRQVAA